MQYLNEINAFGDAMEERPLPKNAQLLWYRLMHRANRNFWRFPLAISNQEAMDLIGVTIHAFLQARKALEDAGLLKVKQGVKGKPSEYTLIPPSVAWGEGGRPEEPPEDGIPYYMADSVDDLTAYFGWTDDVGRELKQITKELLGAYWPDHKPDKRDEQRVFELICEREGEGRDVTIVFPERRKELLAYAFEQASKAGAMNWNYIFGTMRTLAARGITTLQQAWEYDEERSRKNGW